MPFQINAATLWGGDQLHKKTKTNSERGKESGSNEDYLRDGMSRVGGGKKTVCVESGQPIDRSRLRRRGQKKGLGRTKSVGGKDMGSRKGHQIRRRALRRARKFGKRGTRRKVNRKEKGSANSKNNTTRASVWEGGGIEYE